MALLDTFQPFDSPKALLKSAKTDIINFKIASGAFLAHCHPAITEDREAETGDQIYGLRFENDIPAEIRTLAHRIVSDLRHVLDQAVCDAAAQLGRTSRSGLYFPFAKTEHDLGGEVKRKCRNLDSKMINFIMAFKPYRGGNDELWSISHTAGKTKHERIINLGVDFGGFGTGSGSRALRIQGGVEFGMFGWDESHKELKFARLKPGASVSGDIAPTFYIIMGDVEVVGGQPALAVFDHFASEVERILMGIESETARIIASRP